MQNTHSTSVTNSDDTSVLRVLLHTIHGSSPVSTTDFERVNNNAK